MFEHILSLDRQWLLVINGAHSAWADAVFWQVSQAGTWIPLYVLLLVFMLFKFNGKRTTIGSLHIPTFAIALLLFAVAVGGADLLCAQLIKPIVARPRPTHDAELGALVHVVNNYRGGEYGFCSNHAANTMACATLCSAIFTYRQHGSTHLYVTLPLMLWVAINCYSRMYLGVHYPLDILAGLAVGGVMAWLVWLMGKDYLFPRDAHDHHGEG